MPRPKAPEPVFDESKRWLDSYADAVTLLLAFFIMLFAFSLVDKDKFIDFKFGVAQAMGKPNPTLEGGIGLLDRGNGISSDLAMPPVVSTNMDGAEGEYQGEGEITVEEAAELAEAVENALQMARVQDGIDLELDPRGLVLKMDDDILFDSGSALLKLDGVAALNQVAEVVRRIDNMLLVEGHTDNVPTRGGQYATNWELSVSRATHVLRWLVEGREIPAPRISAAGYADTRPRASNATADGRSENRRVELVILLPKEGGPDGQEEEV